jgi:hypothetical protein
LGSAAWYRILDSSTAKSKISDSEVSSLQQLARRINCQATRFAQLAAGDLLMSVWTR